MSKFETLSALKDATVSETGFLYLKRAEFGSLVNEGLAEINEDYKDGNKIATRITDAGLNWLKSFEADSTETETPAATKPATNKENPMSSIEIISGAPIPAGKPRGRAAKSSKYPFDSLEVGQMFFVAATAEKPEPWKTLASLVSDANRRYATEGQTTKINRKGNEVPVLIFTRKFVLRQYEHNGVAGAGIWREK